MTLIPKFRPDEPVCEKHNCRGFCQQCFADMVRHPLEQKIAELEKKLAATKSPSPALPKKEEKYFICQSEYDGGERCEELCLKCSRISAHTPSDQKPAFPINVPDEVFKEASACAYLSPEVCHDKGTSDAYIQGFCTAHARFCGPEQKPDHVHVRLPSGAVANVSPDASPDLLNALDKMCELAKNMPELERNKEPRKYIDTPDQQQWQEMNKDEKNEYLNPEWVKWNEQKKDKEVPEENEAYRVKLKLPLGEHHRLVRWANAINGFYDTPVYLVGSQITGADDPRDVDVICVLPDEDFELRYGNVSKWVDEGDSGMWGPVRRKWSQDCVKKSKHGIRETKLDIDFKVLPKSWSDEGYKHIHKAFPPVRLDTNPGDIYEDQPSKIQSLTSELTGCKQALENTIAENTALREERDEYRKALEKVRDLGGLSPLTELAETDTIVNDVLFKYPKP